VLSEPHQCYKDWRIKMRPSSILFSALAASVVVGLVAPARAAEDPEALVQQAKNLRLAGDDEAAYKLYLRAHNLAKSPETAAHLGMAEINLALWVDAENHLREALKKPNDPFVARNRVPIVEQLKMVRTHLGLLEVVGRPSGAEVEVGGKPVGRLPLPGPLRVPTGETNIRVAADGHKVARRDVTVQPGQLHRIAVELDPVGAPEPPPPVARGGAVPDGSLRSGEAPVRPDADHGPGDWKRPAAWASIVTATALGGVGVLALVTHNADIQRFNDYTSPELTTPDKKCATTAADKGGPYCQKLLKHADDMKRWAIIGLSGAAVAGTVAAILFVNSAPAETAAIRPARGMALACTPTIVGTMGGVCAVRF
jgi:PEGA domain